MLYEVRFDINPRSASRPRFTRSGRTYLAGPYKEFRKGMDQLCDDILGDDWEPLEGPLAVSTKLWTTRPKSTKLYAPKADIDNYLKAVYDSLNGRIWEDDSQVTDIFNSSKRWTDSHETPGSIELIIERPIDFEQNENGTWTDICDRS